MLDLTIVVIFIRRNIEFSLSLVEIEFRNLIMYHNHKCILMYARISYILLFN